MLNVVDTFTLCVGSDDSIAASISIDSEDADQTASALGAYEAHFTYTLCSPPATAINADVALIIVLEGAIVALLKTEKYRHNLTGV